MLWRSYKMKKEESRCHLPTATRCLPPPPPIAHHLPPPPVTEERSHLASLRYLKSSYSHRLKLQYYWCIGHMISLAGVRNHANGLLCDLHYRLHLLEMIMPR
ncbi:hypothetical protein BT93_L0948 [Corymbia citriodora subsp. variegata]|uniref:Uncharacterized protein n=1 Tax=Corymbia citriodora subsp. variegata TaxID=360336 RepID=A0A8T0CXV1_CORYI|nr:hypothetical protein BT93_L0948 [Corymbia citriodora subsp. variegata]